MTDDELKDAERRIWRDRKPGRLGAIHAIELIMALRKQVALDDNPTNKEQPK